MLLSKDTAARVWQAHREIENARKLRAEVEGMIAERRPSPTKGDDWECHLELGFPMRQDNGHRLFRVPLRLGLAVIDAHIAAMQKDLAEASIQASVELQEKSP